MLLDTFSLRQAAEKLNMHIYHGLLSIRESACKKLVVFAELLQMVDGDSIKNAKWIDQSRSSVSRMNLHL